VSRDAGETWNLVGEGSPIDIATLAIAPTTPPTLYAGIAARAPDTYPGYVECDLMGGVSRSVDGGQTWVTAGSGLPRVRCWVRNAGTSLREEPVGVVVLAPDPATPTTIYGLADSHMRGLADIYTSAGDYTRASAQGIVMSDDGGATWVTVNPPTEGLRALALGARH
jgi:hypothetical protein